MLLRIWFTYISLVILCFSFFFFFFNEENKSPSVHLETSFHNDANDKNNFTCKETFALYVFPESIRVDLRFLHHMLSYALFRHAYLLFDENLIITRRLQSYLKLVIGKALITHRYVRSTDWY